jgi:hypothetical protein
MSRFWIATGILSLGLAASMSARAQNVLPSTTGALASFNFGSGANIWNVQIGGCLEKTGNTQIVGDCSNEQVVGTFLSNGSLVLTYSSLHGSSLLNATVTGSSSASEDMSFSEQVTAPSGKLITSVALGLTGNTTRSADFIDIATSETDSGAGQAFNINTNMTNGASPYTVTQQLGTPANVMLIGKDLSASAVTGTIGDSVALNTVTQTFNVPEPASLTVLLVGLGGLLRVRNRRARHIS